MSAEIIHGDCLEVMRGMADGSVDAVITDPPYGMSYVSSRRRHTNAIAVPIAGDAEFGPDFHREWLTEAWRLVRNGGALYLFASDHHLGDFRAAVRDAEWHLKRTLVWVKNAWTSGDLAGDYGHRTEFVVFAHKGRHRLNGPREGNVLEFPRVAPQHLVHSCQKPVPLLGHLIRKSVQPYGLVADPFAGSGSTGVAALMQGRRFIGIERELSYVEIARKRIADAQAQMSLGVA